MQAVHMYLSDRKKTLQKIKEGSPEMFGIVKIMHNIRNPDHWIGKYYYHLSICYWKYRSHNFLSDLV